MKGNVDLALLFQAVCEWESRFEPGAVGDGGASWGIAQIHDDCLADIKRISGQTYTANDRYSIVKTWEIFTYYLLHYGRHYESTTGKPVTYEVLARIWNGGPTGWKKRSTKGYWRNVEKILEKWREKMDSAA